MIYSSTVLTCCGLVRDLDRVRVDCLASAQDLILVLVKEAHEVRDSGAVDKGNRCDCQKQAYSCHILHVITSTKVPENLVILIQCFL